MEEAARQAEREAQRWRQAEQQAQEERERQRLLRETGPDRDQRCPDERQRR
jgi:hypothetical protein